MFRRTITTTSVTVLLTLGTGILAPAQSTNPCAAKNPCAAAQKVDAKLITRSAGVRVATAPAADLLALGERLWKDPTLSTNKLSCQTCHQGNAAFNVTFAKPYPHPVAMAQERAGLAKIDADEMVQICLVVPMATKPLPWNSKELAGLTAYVKHVQKGFRPSAAGTANPCAVTNPRAAKKP
jgi:cytochrome c